MIGVARSALDFAPHRIVPGVGTEDHRFFDPDDLDRDRSHSLLRAYNLEMGRQFAKGNGQGGRAPSLPEALLGMIGSVRAFDADARQKIHGVLNRAHYDAMGPRDYRMPAHVGLRDILYAGLSRGGTESMSGGGTYGFLVKVGYADQVIDKARHTFGPWRFCNIWEVSNSREYQVPIPNEGTQPLTNQFGGFNVGWGYGELNFPPTADGKLANLNIRNDRLLLYTQVSSDAWRDAPSIARWFYYVATTAFRNAVESAMIQGVTGGAGPVGVVNAPSTVVVARQSGSTIEGEDLYNLYQAIADGNTENMVWHGSRAAIQTINALAVNGQYPWLQFPKDWSPNDPHRWPTIFGRPVFTSPYCSAVGTKGDIIAVDWSDYALTWIRPKRSNITNDVRMSGALEFAFGVEPDLAHRGFIGLPEGSLEARVSDQRLFDTDVMAVAMKYRGGGGFFWPSTMVNPSGTTVGPAAVLTTGT